jgi:hypothetical protein
MTLTALRHRRGSTREAAPADASDDSAGAAAPSQAAEVFRAVEGGQRTIRVAATAGSVVARPPEVLATSGVPVVRYESPTSPSVVTSEYPALVTPYTLRPAMNASSAAMLPPFDGGFVWVALPPKRHAPLALRLGVFLLVLLAAATVEVARAKPAWLPKHVVGSVALPPKAVASAPRSKTMTLQSSSSTATVYALPVSTYTIAFSIDHPCWVLVKSVPAGRTVFSRTLLPGSPVPPIEATGSASVLVAARANAIVITDGNRTIGTIQAPVVGHTYLLEAPATQGSATQGRTTSGHTT